MSTMQEHPWAELVAHYSKAERSFDEQIPEPANEDDIIALLRWAKVEGFVVPESYIGFLRVRNGTSFNGLMLYGANIPPNDIFRRQDLVDVNRYQLNRDNETVLGTNDQDTFVIIGDKGPYRRLESASWDVLCEFATCDELLVSIFSQQVILLGET